MECTIDCKFPRVRCKMGFTKLHCLCISKITITEGISIIIINVYTMIYCINTEFTNLWCSKRGITWKRCINEEGKVFKISLLSKIQLFFVSFLAFYFFPQERTTSHHGTNFMKISTDTSFIHSTVQWKWRHWWRTSKRVLLLCVVSSFIHNSLPTLFLTGEVDFNLPKIGRYVDNPFLIGRHKGR